MSRPAPWLWCLSGLLLLLPAPAARPAASATAGLRGPSPSAAEVEAPCPPRAHVWGKYRTLLRKLSQEGATYQKLLDDVRKELAEWYLLQTREPIDGIAERLGYADPSNFSRTFRRWFGTPPGKFRRDRRDHRYN